MPNLVITNVLGADVHIPDLTGRGKSFKVPSGGLTVALSGTQLEFIGPQLDAVQTKGWITYVVTDNASRSNDLEILANAIHLVEQVAVVPAAKGATAIHASVFGDAVGPVTVNTALSNPDVPRNVSLAFGATWDGGNVTINGTNQFDKVIAEVVIANPNNTVVGNSAFKTVTSFAYAGGGVGTHGTNTLTVGTGDKIGLAVNVINTTGVLYMDSALSAVTINSTNDTFLPGTVPNASHSYVVLVNIQS